MAENNIDGSSFLTACLCKLQLPHAEEHANVLPKPIMPTLQLSGEKCPAFGPEHEQTKRVQELLSDVDAARAEDLQRQREFEKKADELLKAYKEGLKCDHWVPLEFEEPGVDRSTARLKYELDHSRFQLAEVRNQLHSLRREMAAYEKLVKQEIGDNVNLHEILNSSRWRGRAQEIERLKKEIAEMESKAYDHKYLKNPLCIPSYKPRFPDVNDLIPRDQVRALENEARKKRDLRDRTEKEVSALMEQYGNISLMYKASRAHNQMLAGELRSLKEQLSKYETRAKDDRGLMKSLIAHQMQIRKMVDREAHLARLVKKKQYDEKDLDGENLLDAAKYRALWEASKSERCSLEKMLQMLTRRLGDVAETAGVAETHCADNEAKRVELEQQLEAQKTASQMSSKSKGSKGKAGKAPPKPDAKNLQAGARLEIVKEENAFLRDFLLRAIQAKVDDLKLYQFTMNSVREQYAETLKKLKAPPDTDSAQRADAE